VRKNKKPPQGRVSNKIREEKGAPNIGYFISDGRKRVGGMAVSSSDRGGGGRRNEE